MDATTRNAIRAVEFAFAQEDRQTKLAARLEFQGATNQALRIAYPLMRACLMPSGKSPRVNGK